MEVYFWYAYLCVVFAAACLVTIDAHRLIKKHGSLEMAWQLAKRHIWKRHFIIVALGIVAFMLLLPLPLYLFSKNVVWLDGVQAMSDYALFALPALAGVVAGGGLVWGRDEGEVINDKNVYFYMASVLILLVSYVIYLFRNFSGLVVGISGASLSLIAMGLLSFQSRVRANGKDVRIKFKVSLYEFCYAVVLIFPPFLWIILALSLYAFRKGLF